MGLPPERLSFGSPCCNLLSSSLTDDAVRKQEITKTWNFDKTVANENNLFNFSKTPEGRDGGKVKQKIVHDITRRE